MIRWLRRWLDENDRLRARVVQLIEANNASLERERAAKTVAEPHRENFEKAIKAAFRLEHLYNAEIAYRKQVAEESLAWQRRAEAAEARLAHKKLARRADCQ